MLAACSTDDDPTGPATEEQMAALNADHWYGEVPISGITDNWRTEEEGDKAPYNHIGAVIYLNGYITDFSYWGFLYLQDDELVNFDGIDRWTEDASFDFTMNANCDITPFSHMPNAPKVNNMHWDSVRDIITADITYNDRTVPIVFQRTSIEEQPTLYDFWMMLLENGMLGYNDEGYELQTGVTDDNADEPSRSRKN